MAVKISTAAIAIDKSFSCVANGNCSINSQKEGSVHVHVYVINITANV